MSFTTSDIDDALELFCHYKTIAETAIGQVTDAQIYEILDPEMNCIASIVKHLVCNMISRWTNFPKIGGENPDFNPSSEFLNPPSTRAELMSAWEDGWSCLFAALRTMPEGDIQGSVTIRGEALSAMQAIHRQLAHYAYHCGQIVFLAKHFQSSQWKRIWGCKRDIQQAWGSAISGIEPIK